MRTMIYRVIDRETIDDVSSAIGFTTTKIPPAKTNVYYALIQAIDGDIRMTIDGTTPTADLGIRLPEDSTVEVWGDAALANFLCIDDGGTAKLEVIYMGIGD